jgi:hypothetical protein
MLSAVGRLVPHVLTSGWARRVIDLCRLELAGCHAPRR